MAVKSQGNQDPFDYHEEKDPFIIKNKRKNESNYYNKTEGDKKKFRFPGQKGDKDEGPQIQVQVDSKLNLTPSDGVGSFWPATFILILFFCFHSER